MVEEELGRGKTAKRSFLSVDEVSRLLAERRVTVPFSAVSGISRMTTESTDPQHFDGSDFRRFGDDPRRLGREHVEEVFTALTGREMQVLQSRFGVGMTPKEIAKDIGWSVSTVRRDIRSALGKLRYPSHLP